MSPIDLINFMVAPVACNQTSPVLSTDQLVIIYHQLASNFTPLCMCQIKDGRLSCLHLFLQVLYPLTLNHITSHHTRIKERLAEQIIRECKKN